MNCPICGCPAREAFQVKHGRAARCSSARCRHVWVLNPPPGAGVYQCSSLDADVCKERDLELGRFLRSRGFLRPGARVLDFGAGRGHMIEVFRSQVPGVHIVAVEAEPANAAALRAAGFETHARLEALPSEPFDRALLVEVISHLEDPVAVLSDIRRRVRSDAMLFFTTPSAEARFGSPATMAFDAPEHVQFFNERSLALALKRAGFSSVRCETINAMTSRLTRAPARYLKDFARPIHGLLFGRMHLTGFATA